MLSGRESRILFLLVISGFLNYVDRANLSVGLTNIQAELHISPYRLGLLQSAFFWTYAAFQLFAIAGWLPSDEPFVWRGFDGFNQSNDPKSRAMLERRRPSGSRPSASAHGTC